MVSIIGEPEDVSTVSLSDEPRTVTTSFLMTTSAGVFI